MKVVLDLDNLLSHKKISQAEYSKLQLLAYDGTASLAFTLLLTFGIVAITASIVALSPTYLTMLLCGIALLLVGVGIQFSLPQWRLLADIVAVIGVLLTVMGLTGVPHPGFSSLWLSAVLLALASVWLQNGLLIALSVLTSFAALESSLYFYHASYGLSVQQPLIVIVFFSALAWGIYQLSRRLPAHFARLAIIASRVAVLLVNFGFWIGSFWGSGIAIYGERVPPVWFSLGWGLALLGCMVWAWRHNKRWVLNCCSVFAAIHFFSQWFLVLSASPGSVLIAGCLVVLLALLIRWVDIKMQVKIQGTLATD